MREYRAHFSFYDEEYGQFDDEAYYISALSPFEAREKAWDTYYLPDNMRFKRNIKSLSVNKPICTK